VFFPRVNFRTMWESREKNSGSCVGFSRFRAIFVGSGGFSWLDLGEGRGIAATIWRCLSTPAPHVSVRACTECDEQGVSIMVRLPRPAIECNAVPGRGARCLPCAHIGVAQQH
jgi:hypothetical protein